MGEREIIIACLAGWLALAAFTIHRQWRRSGVSVGLVLAHAMNMWLFHWVAVVFYLFPWYGESWFPRDLVFSGFYQSFIATAAFCIGSLFSQYFFSAKVLLPRVNPRQGSDTPGIAWFYLAGGFLAFFFLGPALERIPGAAAFVGSAWNLFVIGVVLLCWRALQKGSRKQLIMCLVASLTMPLLKVTSSGFIAYGVAMLIVIAAFVITFYRPRWHIAIFAVFGIYFFLSIFVTYMRDRQILRDQAKQGEAIESKFNTVYEMARTFEPFDPYYIEHLWRIDTRLNQGVFTGMAQRYIEDGHKEFGYGDTLIDGGLALIPRALWPGKPMGGGSGTLVADYTGIPFNNQETAVGVGHVLELYINFGTFGVIVGFFMLGAALTLIDRFSAQRLHEGNWPAASYWFLLGMGFLGVGNGSSVEFTVSLVASAILLSVLNRYVIHGVIRQIRGFKRNQHA